MNNLTLTDTERTWTYRVDPPLHVDDMSGRRCEIVEADVRCVDYMGLDDDSGPVWRVTLYGHTLKVDGTRRSGKQPIYAPLAEANTLMANALSLARLAAGAPPWRYQ